MRQKNDTTSHDLLGGATDGPIRDVQITDRDKELDISG